MTCSTYTTVHLHMQNVHYLQTIHLKICWNCLPSSLHCTFEKLLSDFLNDITHSWPNYSYIIKIEFGLGFAKIVALIITERENFASFMKDKDIKLCSSYFWLVEANFQKYYTSSVYNNVEFLHLVLILRCHFVGEKGGIAKCWLLSQAIVKFDQTTCKRKSVWK